MQISLFNVGIFERLVMKNHIPSRGEKRLKLAKYYVKKKRKFVVKVIFNNELKNIIFSFLDGRLV